MSDLFRKYIPKTWDDIVGQKDIVAVLSKYKSIQQLPHFMFAGPPGCGKTACTYVLARTLSLPIIELNASDERGIETVREKVKTLLFTAGDGRLILLDEADNLCLLGNTEVTANGIQTNIENLVGKTFSTLSYDFTKREVVDSEARCISSGDNLLFEVTLDDGRKIVCSQNQPFFDKIGRVKKLRELRVGDEIATFDR